jgi:signal peptidase I
MNKRKVIFLSVVVLLIAGLVLSWWRIKPILVFKTYSASMLPNFKKGDHIYTSRFKKFSYNDVVLFQIPALLPNLEKPYITMQRIVAMEGDTVEINDDYLIRNGRMADTPQKLMLDYFVRKALIRNFDDFNHLLEKPRIQNDTVIFTLTYAEYQTWSRSYKLYRYGDWKSRTRKPLVVPKGYCYLLGDNRDNAIDSRYRGCLPLSNIITTVIFNK